MSSLPIEVHDLNPPPLSTLAAILTPALAENYTASSVTVTPSPDLTLPPFHLTSPGLTGTPIIADIGGQSNLFPHPNLSAKYDLLNIARQITSPTEPGLFIGAGAAPWHIVGQNAELAPNISWDAGFSSVRNQSWCAMVKDAVSCHPCASSEFALMMNLFGCQGRPGEVLRITAKGRTGQGKSFAETIRTALKDMNVSLGGAFVMKKGTAKVHVMPEFRESFASREEVEEWLTFHDVEAKQGKELVCLSVLHSEDHGLGLRMEHTHCFSLGGSGGHYHYDLDGEVGGEVEYEGYFNVAERIFRIDRPQVK